MSSLLSVVVPCFNEEEVIAETHRRLVAELERISIAHELRYEIVYVDDGSRDHTLALIQELCAHHHRTAPDSKGQVSVVALARNFGHQLALSAGLRRAKGDAVVAIDADLQDPPEVIEDMVRSWRAGHDVVYGVRLSREGESRFKKLTAHTFYRLVRRLTRMDIPLDTGDFRLMTRRVVDVLNGMGERQRFIRGMVPWIGFKQDVVHYHRAARFAGTTKYPLRKMLRFAFDGITSFSNVPLQLTYWFGLAAAFLALAYLGWVFFEWVALGTAVRGWSSLMAATLFLGAVQLITIGILGEYIGRIYDEVKRRPLYVIDEEASRSGDSLSGGNATGDAIAHTSKDEHAA